MAFELITTSAETAIESLARAIASAKGADRLAPTTVVVPTNVSGVMARRALGRDEGVIGVDMVTLNRLAELLAGPTLASQQRQPVSTPVLELTVRKVLDEAPGSYRPVADHPATVTALREVHEELRLAGPTAVESLTGHQRGREAARVSAAITRILSSRWYDEADLFSVATERLGPDLPTTLRNVVLYLPGRLDGLAVGFVRRLAEFARVVVVTSLTGDPDADAAHLSTLDSLGIERPEPPRPRPILPARVVSTTDADDEADIAVRCVIDAARGAVTGRPVPFERIAVLWPAHRPYARLVEHHLAAASIPWNGRGGTELSERLAPRLLLDLLDVDRRGLRRRALFELLADVPSRQADGSPRPTAAWERVSRVAGVSADDDWIPRLHGLRDNERWGESATALAAFVTDLRSTLGRRGEQRTWRSWVDWCVEQLDGWLGTGAISRFSDAEYRAWEGLMSALERLRCLDAVGDPVTRSEFRSVLESELDSNGVRTGRIGTGVTVGSLASAAGLDIDVAIILGCAEGLLPPAPRSDPLLSDADRQRAGLVRADERSVRLHHEFRSLVGGVHTIVTMPRGDLRATTSNQTSRWLVDVEPSRIDVVASSASGLADVVFAPSERERRLGDLLRSRRAGRELAAAHDPLLAPRLAMRSAREGDSISEFDGDLSAADVPPVVGGVVSPTQIETWVACPHAYFVRYLLKVYPVDEPDSDISISAMDRGLVQHDTLDLFHHDVLTGRLPQPTVDGWTDQHREALLAHFDDVCARYELSGRTGRPATWAGERARMRADLLGWLAHDSELARARGITVLDSEHRFPADDDGTERPTFVSLPLPDGRELAVRGAVDRLDRAADGTLIVTDHKTGRDTKFRGLSADDPTLAGTVFQLPTYAAAALARFGERPSDDGISAVRSEYSMFAKGGYKRIGYDAAPDVWERVRDHLGNVVDGIESGWYPQLPERPGFRLWPSCWYCEPDGLGTAEAWTRWVAKRRDERIARWFTNDDGSDPDDEEDADHHV